jgi:Fe-S-cluster containining protein
MARDITHRYLDPLSEIWLATAARLGLSVERVADAYASTTGGGVLRIAEEAALDADDSLAQMIFHEICHSLVEGEESFTKPDWGIDNIGTDHEWREHACLRTQWVLAGRYGLRQVLAPTTDFRAIWDRFDGALLADRSDLAVQAAIVAIGRAAKPPWAPALDEALAATARIGGEVTALRQRAAQGRRPAGAGPRTATGPGAAVVATSGAAAPSRTSLWRELEPPPPLHPSGLPAGVLAGATCGSCAWRFEARGAARCRQAGAKIDDTWPACERYEAELDCQTCGACCRAAYHSVEVARKDPMIKRHPELVVDRGTFLEVRRAGDRCAALTGGGEQVQDGHHRMLPMACAIYDDRPRTCRDFTLGSEHCVTARRRVGLSL